MPNVVVDANVVISAGLKPHSLSARAILLARSHATIVLSDAVEAEIRSVIARPKFEAYAVDLNLILGAIAAIAERHEPDMRVTDCRAAKDNKYLELAAAVQAAMIVSGDDDLLVLHPWRGIDIVNAGDYVRRFEGAAGSDVGVG
jgi:putative PIN family toxin of toxin-antitoxin system